MTARRDDEGGWIITALLFALCQLREDSGRGRVTIDDIEGRLRSIGSDAQQVIVSSRQNVIAAGIVGGAVAIAGAYLHGRRRGRRRATVLEVRRVP